MSWTSKTLSEALGLDLLEKAVYGSVQYNSADVNVGDIFIAMGADALPTIKGTKDSHVYVQSALDKGAALAIVERDIDGVDSTKLLIVQDAFQALKKMARYKRTKSSAKFIAITGSAGKTSTKDAMCTALNYSARSFSNPGTFNNELGIPLTLASIPLDVEYVVMEIGMNHPGEIRAMIHDIAPDCIMINNILPVHLENFTSLDGIADAKLEVLEGLKSDGIALFNADSEYFEYCVAKAKKLGVKNIYGFGESCGDGRLISYDFMNNITTVKMSVYDQLFTFTTPIAGKHRIMNLVGVLTMCKLLGIDPAESSKAFVRTIPPKGRGQVHHIIIHEHNCTIIDDSYNASPIATIESLKHMRDLVAKQKIVILANMMELGPKEIEYHESLLPYIIDAGVSKIYTVGNLMKSLYDIAPMQIRGAHFVDYKALESHLDKIVDSDMMILLKGSKSQKLSYIVEKLLQKSRYGHAI
jgi:UDP-N-acetylmuramoyl-tripeptide--D-alanyl-D-alanine ligase